MASREWHPGASVQGQQQVGDSWAGFGWIALVPDGQVVGELCFFLIWGVWWGRMGAARGCGRCQRIALA